MEEENYMEKILVTPRSLSKNGHPYLAKIEAAGYEIIFPARGVQPSEDDLLKLLPECTGYLAGVEKINSRILDSAKKLKVISRNGTGIDNVDLSRAKELNIIIKKTDGANARGVAELTIAHILCAVRSIPFHDSAIKLEQWERVLGIELEGKTLGLFGCGNIGQIVARLAVAFGMNVQAFEPYPDKNFQEPQNFKYSSIDEVLKTSDIISLHCPPAKDGIPLINKDTIGKMKNGVYIINTAREGLIDSTAIISGIENGKIAGFTIDAFDTEPPLNWELAKNKKVVATQHIGSYTRESVDRATVFAVDNLLSVLDDLKAKENQASPLFNG